MFDRLSPKSQQIFFAIVLSCAASICEHGTAKCPIEFVAPGYYHFHWDAPLSESIQD